MLKLENSWQIGLNTRIRVARVRTRDKHRIRSRSRRILMTRCHSSSREIRYRSGLTCGISIQRLSGRSIGLISGLGVCPITSAIRLRTNKTPSDRIRLRKVRRKVVRRVTVKTLKVIRRPRKELKSDWRSSLTTISRSYQANGKKP